MRKLTIRQKKLLDEWYEENKNKPSMTHFFDMGINVELLEKLEEINNTEILYQEINRYMGDKITDGRYEK